MSVRCPDGHSSQAEDYCDVCGLPMPTGSAAASSGPLAAAPAVAPPAGAPPAGAPPAGATSSLDLGASPPAAIKNCPNCATPVPGEDLFCENCGYDFTTGALPAPGPAPSPAQGAQPPPATPPAPPPPPDAPLTWIAEVWVDPDWYATQDSAEACPSAGMPVMRPLWDSSVLVGRLSASRSIRPQIDAGADHGVSRRHVQLTTDGQRWWAEDLQSANGTYIGQAGAPLPSVAIPVGQRVEFAPGDRIYLGAWTRIVIRRATADEQ